MKKIFICLITLFLVACSNSLPLPELEEGIRGKQLGIDKNINEETIDKYLNRNDAIYRDMRLLYDEAHFEEIGGDSTLSGIVKGFEVVPYPYICKVEGLPAEVGQAHQGPSLFSQNEDGDYIANYEEANIILEELFPKDKIIFLMCGGGGYAGMMRQLLISQGYDENKIYNAGGYWYYKGKNAISTLKENGEVDTSKFIYHDIDFATLTPKPGYDPSKEIKIITRDSKIIELNDLLDLETMINNKEDFVLLISLKGCATCAAFKPIIDECSLSLEEPVYEIDISKVEKALNIQYTPTLQVYKNGEVVNTLKPDSNNDIKYFEDSKYLIDWIEKNY